VVNTEGTTTVIAGVIQLVTPSNIYKTVGLNSTIIITIKIITADS